MNPENRIKKETFWVLNKIREEYLLSDKRPFVFYFVASDKDVPDSNRQANIIEKLKGFGIITCRIVHYRIVDPDKNTISYGVASLDEQERIKQSWLEIKVNQKRFDRFYNKTKVEVEALTKNSSNNLLSNQDNRQDIEEINILYLDKNGDFYRKSRNKKCCYPMDSNGLRYKIVLFLANNQGRDYQSTDLITVETRGSSGKNENTSRDIKDIRNNIEKYLGINGKELIEGKRRSGYQINPNYTIRLE